MGNLGRAGYSASTDGLWPYSYDTCDLGVTANQSNSGVVSWLPGQRLNKCLCSNQDTPSPGVGRGASELDLLEGAGGDNGVNGDEGNNGGGTISQSHQFAPFDIGYKANSQYVSIYNTSSTYKNSYDGGKLQQVISIKTKIDPQYYEGRAYQTYAFDYTPGPQGRVTWWVGDDKKWSFDAKAVDPNTQAKIGQRVISEEPMVSILLDRNEASNHINLSLLLLLFSI
jgi:beta-glucanase (GH16 family)